MNRFTAVCLTLLGLHTTACGSAADDTEGSPETATEEIIGGAKSKVPAVGVLITPDGGFCTASLITPSQLLTAAHCVLGEGGVATPLPPRGFHFYVNNTNLAAVWEGANTAYNGDRYDVVALKVPPWLKFETFNNDLNNDVALLTLSKAVRGVQPLPVSPTGLTEQDVGSDADTVGYGDSSPYGDLSGQLHAKQAIEALSTMHVLAGQVGINDSVGVSNISTCYGDSGGPLLDQSRHIIGVVSSGEAALCAGEGVYTRVDRYASFISGKGSRPDPVDVTGCGSDVNNACITENTLRSCDDNSLNYTPCQGSGDYTCGHIRTGDDCIPLSSASVRQATLDDFASPVYNARLGGRSGDSAAQVDVRGHRVRIKSAKRGAYWATEVLAEGVAAQGGFTLKMTLADFKTLTFEARAANDDALFQVRYVYMNAKTYTILWSHVSDPQTVRLSRSLAYTTVRVPTSLAGKRAVGAVELSFPKGLTSELDIRNLVMRK